MITDKPTIKGIFVNSHINTLKNIKGEDGLNELERRFGSPPVFKNSDDVPVSDEVKIIEICLDLLSERLLPENERAFEAGRLHFRNFSKTPLGRIIFSVFRNNFKLLMMQTKYLAGHVFRGVKFSSEDLGDNSIKVVMKNNDYPIDHFKGLFMEWMEFSGRKGTINARQLPPNTYEYIMKWDE
jgi:uncharacterized protein (TIGR02265 family)